MIQLLKFLFSQFTYMAEAEASLAGGGGEPPIEPAAARTFVADFVDVPADLPDDKVTALHGRIQSAMAKHGPKPAEIKPEELKAATEFLSKNVDGFDPKTYEKKPEEIMRLRGAHDVWTASESRKFLKANGAKPEDVTKMSNADAIKAAEEARGKEVQYDYKYPDGFQKDEAADVAFKTWLKENGVKPAAAQKLVDLYAGLAQKAATAPYDLWKKTQEGWRADTAKDPEIGGEAMPRNLAAVGKMIDAVAGPKAKDVRQVLDFTGAGNHPEMIRFLFNLSKPYAEGGPLNGGVISRDKTGNPATALYPDQPSETAG